MFIRRIGKLVFSSNQTVNFPMIANVLIGIAFPSYISEMLINLFSELRIPFKHFEIEP